MEATNFVDMGDATEVTQGYDFQYIVEIMTYDKYDRDSPPFPGPGH